jgi:hypothetical protein
MLQISFQIKLSVYIHAEMITENRAHCQQRYVAGKVETVQFLETAVSYCERR